MKKYLEKYSYTFSGFSCDKKTIISAVVGILIGLSPLPGLTSFICVGISILFNLKHLVVLAFNYLVFPVQLLLLIPMLQAGGWMIGYPIKTGQLIPPGTFSGEWLIWIRDFGNVLLGGLAIWGIGTVIMVLMLMLMLHFNRFAFFNR